MLQNLVDSTSLHNHRHRTTTFKVVQRLRKLATWFQMQGTGKDMDYHGKDVLLHVNKNFPRVVVFSSHIPNVWLVPLHGYGEYTENTDLTSLLSLLVSLPELILRLLLPVYLLLFNLYWLYLFKILHKFNINRLESALKASRC